jgi:hypothetical protein
MGADCVATLVEKQLGHRLSSLTMNDTDSILIKLGGICLPN